MDSKSTSTDFNIIENIGSDLVSITSLSVPCTPENWQVP